MKPAEPIRSRSHPQTKRLRDIRDGRDKNAALFVEGLKVAEELLASGLKPIEYFHTVAWAESPKSAGAIGLLREKNIPGRPVSDDVMDFISDTQSPPGLILLAERPRWELKALLDQKNPLLVILDGLQLPNNAGAIMRAAEAAGVQGILSTAGTCDLYGPKTLRAASGSAFRLPMVPSLPRNEIFDACKKAGLSVVSADSRGGASFRDWDWKRGTALLLGAEGPGLANFPPEFSPTPIHIPMKGPVESLNVSVAAGIILFEAHRQREGGR